MNELKSVQVLPDQSGRFYSAKKNRFHQLQKHRKSIVLTEYMEKCRTLTGPLTGMSNTLLDPVDRIWSFIFSTVAKAPFIIYV